MNHSIRTRHRKKSVSCPEGRRNISNSVLNQSETNNAIPSGWTPDIDFSHAGLSRELEAQGQWLFRWRSYLPFLFAPIIFTALIKTSWPFKDLAFHEFWEMSCLTISMIGFGIRVLTIGHVPAGTSGRNTEAQLANSLNQTGIYSVVRHPLYLGNYLIGLGAMMVPFKWWLPLLYSLSFAIYYERIMFAEECFLVRKFGRAFIAWAEVTPAFVPQLWKWRPATESFSVRNVLKREYTGFLVVLLLHASLETVVQSNIQEHFVLDGKWELLIVIGLATYLTMRSLKKYSSILDVPGR